ncbi:MAG: GNAT family N-acetyltransferase [Pyrinomonadaceae bacterium]
MFKQHIIEKDVEIFLAETSAREVVGFLVWTSTYDLHWCLKDGVIVDLYVCPQHRSRGVAVLLTTELAAEIQWQAASFCHENLIGGVYISYELETSSRMLFWK